MIGTRRRGAAIAGAVLVLAVALRAMAAAVPAVTTIHDAAPLKKAIAAHKGSVVVVNFWATYCGPCVQEFPALVKLQHAHRNGLTLITVSQDSPKDVGHKVKPFLARQHADFPQFLLDTRDPDGFIDAMDPTWHGNLPRTLVYDRTGRLVKSLSAGQTTATLEAAVRPLLAAR